MTIISVSGRRRFRVSPADPLMVQVQPQHKARWLDYRKTTSLQQSSALVLLLAREDETQEVDSGPRGLPMTSKLGTYWSVMHRRASDYAYFRKLQPSVFKIMDGGQSDYQWAREHLPDSLIIPRDWAMSEQHQDMLKDPAGTGKRHAQEWSSHQTRLGFDRAKTLVLGINEPKVWDGGVAEALRVYTIAMCDEAKRLDLRVGAMQFSVGWPNNRGGDSDPDWSPWHGVEAAIKRGNHMLVTHEYWADSGPQENWGWWGGRVLKCPWQVPIVIGETGVDMYVKDASGPHADRGWRRHLSPSPYAAQLAEYVGLMSCR